MNKQIMKKLYAKMIKEGWPVEKKFIDLSEGEMAYLVEWIIDFYNKEMSELPF